MITLSSLKSRKKRSRRVGRGVGCKKGKTCGRGHKGDKSRSGYKRRLGQEGGQMPLFRKMPARGFTNGRFRSEGVSINLETLDQVFSDGEIVTLQALREKGLAPRRTPGGLKILGKGELKKQVTIEAHNFSQSARKKLEKAKIGFKEIPISPKTL